MTDGSRGKRCLGTGQVLSNLPPEVLAQLMMNVLSAEPTADASVIKYWIDVASQQCPAAANARTLAAYGTSSSSTASMTLS